MLTRKLTNSFLIFFLVLIFLSCSIFAGTRNVVKILYKGRQIECYENEIIIKIKSGVELSSIFNGQNKISLIKSVANGKISKVKIRSDLNYDSILDSLNASPLIDYAEPNYVVRAQYTYPNDTYFQSGCQWSLYNTGQSPIYGTADADIDITEAWDIKTSANSVLVAILDSGFPVDLNGDPYHSDLDDPNKFIIGNNFSDDVIFGMLDVAHHGSHVAGIIGAESNNNNGISGIIWEGNILIIKVLNENGEGDWVDIKEGVEYAIDYADSIGKKLIINGSIGDFDYSSTAKQMVDEADNNNILQIYAAGNNGSGDVCYPAVFGFDNYINEDPTGVEWDAISNILSVGATDKDDNLASYSSYNPNKTLISVSAPGGDTENNYSEIYSTLPDVYTEDDDVYGYKNGTSMAAPHVTGIAALVWDRFSSYTSTQVKTLIEKSSEDVNSNGVDVQLGHGRINAYYALAAPATPSGFSVTGSVGQYPTLNWSPNTEPDLGGYKIYCKIGSESEYLLATVSSTTTTYIDRGVTIGEDGKFVPNACYRISAIDINSSESGKTSYECKPVGGIQKPTEEEITDLPDKYLLYPVYPNPFNSSTTIRFVLPEDSHLQLSIYDINGNEIWKYNNCTSCKYPAGYHSVVWNGVNKNGLIISTGVYIAIMKTPSYFTTQKILFIK